MAIIGIMVLLGVMCGLSWKTLERHGTMKYKAHSLCREKSYKVAELRGIGKVRKMSAAEMLIWGVMKQGIGKAGLEVMKRRQNGPNNIGRYLKQNGPNGIRRCLQYGMKRM